MTALIILCAIMYISGLIQFYIDCEPDTTEQWIILFGWPILLSFVHIRDAVRLVKQKRK